MTHADHGDRAVGVAPTVCDGLDGAAGGRRVGDDGVLRSARRDRRRNDAALFVLRQSATRAAGQDEEHSGDEGRELAQAHGFFAFCYGGGDGREVPAGERRKRKGNDGKCFFFL